jgi:hypothetical protein
MAAAAQGVGTGLNVFGELQAGKQEERTAQFNASVMEQEGEAAVKKAEFDEALLRERVRKTLSSQRAAIGASGVDVSGTAAKGLEETAISGEIDALAIRHGGAIAKARAASGAAAERFRGKAARKASRIRAGGSLLTGGAGVAKNA